jgi:hypothetical protein
MRRHGGWAALAAVVVTGGLAGCGGSSQKKSSLEGAVTPSGGHIKLRTPSAVAKGERTVKLKVIATRSRATIAVIPVYIGGKGPYPFALDTGAMKSLVDSKLAADLHLRNVGQARGAIVGVAGSERGSLVEIRNWRAGQIALHPETIAAARLTPGGNGPAGLLGSDVLSRYGKVAVDYDHDLLLLDPPVK